MTSAIPPSPAVSPRVQMTARQRACLEQIARRQTSPQRLVRRVGVPKLAQRDADEGSDKALTTMIEGALADQPRAGTLATFTAEQIVQIVAVACEDPADSGRPVSHWTPREVAEEVRKRGLIETISTRSVGRFLKSGGFTAPSGRVLAQRQA